jgi:hypothetical protein
VADDLRPEDVKSNAGFFFNPRKLISEDNQPTEKTCRRCKMQGHRAKNCPKEMNRGEKTAGTLGVIEKGQLSAASNNTTSRCFRCDQKGHIARDCNQQQQIRPKQSVSDSSLSLTSSVILSLLATMQSQLQSQKVQIQANIPSKARNQRAAPTPKMISLVSKKPVNSTILID